MARYQLAVKHKHKYQKATRAGKQIASTYDLTLLYFTSIKQAHLASEEDPDLLH